MSLPLQTTRIYYGKRENLSWAVRLVPDVRPTPTQLSDFEPDPRS